MDKIVVDRGHGGSDPGAVGYVKERTVAVKVGDYMVAYLKKNYIVDIMETVGTDNLNTRCAKANKWGADLFVSLHFNAGRGNGYEALVYGSGNLKLGQCFEKHVKAVGQNSRGVKYRPDLAVLRLTDCKAILNEIAFVDNKADIRDWDENAELKKMGEALAKAAADWLNLKKKGNAEKPKATQKATLKVGVKVKIKAGAKDLNTKKAYSDFVYKTTYTVISIVGDRVVFGLNGKATGATNKSNIKLV